MPSILALLGCYAFVLWVFRRDARQRPYPSAGLWLATLWMMRCASRGIDNWGWWFGFRMDPVLVFGFLLAGLIVLVRRHIDWGGLMAGNWTFFLFMGYLLLSLVWVETLEDPLVKAFRPMTDFVMALVLVTERDPKAALITMFRRTAILLIPLSVVLIKYFPHLGRGEAKHWGSDLWIGVTTHKNPLGQLCLISGLSYLWLLYRTKKEGLSIFRDPVPWIYLALTIYLFNGGGHSRSTTSIVSLIVAVVFFCILTRMRHDVGGLMSKLVMLLLFVAGAELFLGLMGTSIQGVVAGLSGKDTHLTGRAWLWNDVIRIGMEKPVLGSGYGGFWVSSIYGRLSPAVDNDPSQSHNGYLETFANLGLIGVALLALVILQAFTRAVRLAQQDFEYGRITLVLIAMVLVMNYAEATFPRGSHVWWFGFLVVAMYGKSWVWWPEVEEVHRERHGHSPVYSQEGTPEETAGVWARYESRDSSPGPS